MYSFLFVVYVSKTWSEHRMSCLFASFYYLSITICTIPGHPSDPGTLALSCLLFCLLSFYVLFRCLTSHSQHVSAKPVSYTNLSFVESILYPLERNILTPTPVSSASILLLVSWHSNPPIVSRTQIIISKIV